MIVLPATYTLHSDEFHIRHQCVRRFQALILKGKKEGTDSLTPLKRLREVWSLSSDPKIYEVMEDKTNKTTRRMLVPRKFNKIKSALGF